jgi:hypothetical protein
MLIGVGLEKHRRGNQKDTIYQNNKQRICARA